MSLEDKSRIVTRRQFVQGATATAVGVAGFPYILRAQEAPKIRLAFVGTGGRAGGHVNDLKNAKFGITYVAGCDVELGRADNLKKVNPDAKIYTDWREMFDKHLKEIDAVVVTTPDHNHALPSLRAILEGKHVYCEKPLTWSIEEARLMQQATQQKKVATQMGNQGHANVQNRRIVEYIRAGVIGDVKEVYTWTNRPVWPQGDLKREAATMPAGMNWDAWIGPAPMRDYHKNLHPFGWRGWFEFGCGAVGDMGCHTWDNVFWAMQPDYPSQVELLEIEGKGAETFPSKSHFKWTFPAKGNRPGFVGHWYSGGMKPNALLEEHYKAGRFTENGKPAGYTNSGSIYVGSKGQLVTFGDYGSAPQVFPEELGKDLKVEASIPRSPGHYDEWVMAIKGEKPWNFPGSNFADYAAPITEVMLVGAIAEKIGEVGLKIDCDAEKREIITPRAAAYRGREYRKGWELPKL